MKGDWFFSTFDNMKLVSITDRYIHYLRSRCPNVLDPKDGVAQQGRKYIGALFSVRGNMYFAPLSSPKKTDFDSEGKIRPSTFGILRMIDIGAKKELLATMRLSNMIPVPDSEVVPVDYSAISDNRYFRLLQKEEAWVLQNEKTIEKNALRLYHTKTHDKPSSMSQAMWDAFLPYDALEKHMKEFVAETGTFSESSQSH